MGRYTATSEIVRTRGTCSGIHCCNYQNEETSLQTSLVMHVGHDLQQIRIMRCSTHFRTDPSWGYRSEGEK
jgi:hypothetical protein